MAEIFNDTIIQATGSETGFNMSTVTPFLNENRTGLPSNSTLSAGNSSQSDVPGSQRTDFTTEYITTTLLMTTVQPEVLLFPAIAWVVFKIIHAILTTVALGANCLSLGVIYGIVTRLTPPLQVLTSLGFSDMLAPWAVMTMYFPASTCQREIHGALMLLAHNAGALTLLSYALIHSIATYRPLQYEKIVTQRRVWITINLIWIVSLFSAHIHFLAVFLHKEQGSPYCEQVEAHFGVALTLTAAILATTVLVTVLIYGRLFLHLRPIEAIVGSSNEPRHSTKGVITGVLLVAVFLLGWGPYLISRLEELKQRPHLQPDLLIGLSTSQVFVLLMCTAHPVIYGLRMTNMYMGYHRLLQRFRGWFVTSWTRVRNIKGDGDDQPSTPLNPIESIC